jgi:dihydropyrimidine dehydrogenase (NAD+) subunit PreA
MFIVYHPHFLHVLFCCLCLCFSFPGKKAGITLANSFPVMNFKDVPDIDGVWEKGIVYGMAGEGVVPMSYLCLASVPRDSEGKGMEISGNGGVFDYKAAAHFMALGCNTVQMCTLPTRFGVDIVKDLSSGLSHFLETRDITSIKGLSWLIC